MNDPPPPRWLPIVLLNCSILFMTVAGHGTGNPFRVAPDEIRARHKIPFPKL
jgi:hypothetical protein